MGRFFGEYLALSSWWSSLAAKIFVSSIMELVEDIAKDKNREMIPKTLGVPSIFLYIS